jgi:hypothetical protein
VKKRKKKKNTKKTITSGKTKNPGRRRTTTTTKLHTHLPSARNNKVGMDPNDMTKGGRSSSSCSSSSSRRSSSRGTKKKSGGGRREEGLEGYWVGGYLQAFLLQKKTKIRHQQQTNKPTISPKTQKWAWI